MAAEILRRLDQTFDVTLDKLEVSVAKLSSLAEWVEGQRHRTEAEKKDQGDQS